MFDGLKAAGAKWDVIGMSLYPDDSNWQSYATQCLNNITTLYNRYNTPCMICEVGMSWDSSKASSLMSTLIKNGKQNKACLGLFYWEPECYHNFQDTARVPSTVPANPPLPCLPTQFIKKDIMKRTNNYSFLIACLAAMAAACQCPGTNDYRT